jgi:hypothetical protein
MIAIRAAVASLVQPPSRICGPRTGPLIGGPSGGRSSRWSRGACLDADRGNFWRAMNWAIESGETIVALRYAVALWRYWRQLGEFTEGRRWTEQALGMAGGAPASLRAKALGAAAGLALPQGDYGRLAELASEAIGLAYHSDDPIDMRNALTL